MNLDILTPSQVEQLTALITASDRIVLTGHSRPDGDAVGACLGWADYLRVRFGKEPVVVLPNAYPDFLQWLPGSERIVRFDKHPDQVKTLFDEAQLVFCLDYNAPERLDDLMPLLVAAKAPKVLIDHHLGPAIDAVVTVSEPTMSSTSEIVFRLVWQLGGFDELTKSFAVPVYCGMMTDTGGFTYNSSQPEIYFVICQLLTKNIDKDKIYRNVFNNYSSWAIRLRGYLMCQKLNVFPDDHASYYAVTSSEMHDYHFVRGDLEGLVNEPLRIKGNRMSISLREDDRVPNRIWVSLRSVDSFSVEEVARLFFNGGGHFNASGGKLDCSMDQAEAITRKAIAFFGQKYFGAHPDQPQNPQRETAAGTH
jgi:phosphoesterase RecJ-like protein